MYDEHTHPLLVQVPLTVSPFVSLPTATTLPYTYKSLPSTLPPSSTGPDVQDVDPSKSKFITSASGQAASPDEVIASCQALQKHLQKLRDDAKAALENWEREVSDRDLAEKRRVAPGWLDSESKILVPNALASVAASKTPASVSLLDEPEQRMVPQQKSTDEKAGEELDRAFGTMSMEKKSRTKRSPVSSSFQEPFFVL